MSKSHTSVDRDAIAEAREADAEKKIARMASRPVKHLTLAAQLGVEEVDWKAAMSKAPVAPTATPAIILAAEPIVAKAEPVSVPVVEVPVQAAPAPVVAAAPKAPAEAKKPLIAKLDKTVLASGLSYSLLSRVQHAFSTDQRKVFEAGKKMLSLVDGRGQTQEISSAYEALAIELGGHAYLSTVRTSHVKTELKKRGILK